MSAGSATRTARSTSETVSRVAAGSSGPSPFRAGRDSRAGPAAGAALRRCCSRPTRCAAAPAAGRDSSPPAGAPCARRSCRRRARRAAPRASLRAAAVAPDDVGAEPGRIARRGARGRRRVRRRGPCAAGERARARRSSPRQVAVSSTTNSRGVTRRRAGRRSRATSALNVDAATASAQSGLVAGYV